MSAIISFNKDVYWKGKTWIYDPFIHDVAGWPCDNKEVRELIKSAMIVSGIILDNESEVVQTLVLDVFHQVAVATVGYENTTSTQWRQMVEKDSHEVYVDEIRELLNIIEQVRDQRRQSEHS